MFSNLRQIKAFLAVAKLQNFTRAAAELNISQSALSVQIRQIEELLGIALFDRNRRRVNITPAGQSMLPRLKRIADDIEAVIADARDASGTMRGMVTVAALPSLAMDLLPRATAILARQYPGITVRILDTVSARVVSLARHGEVDFGLGSAASPDRDIVCKHLFKDRFCAFVAPTHALASCKSLSLAELAKLPVILPIRESSVRIEFDMAAHRAGIVIKPAYEAVYNSTLIGLAREGLGVAVLSELIAHGDITLLKGIAIVEPVIEREIVLITPKDRALSPAAVIFAEILREQARRIHLHNDQ